MRTTVSKWCSKLTTKSRSSYMRTRAYSWEETTKRPQGDIRLCTPCVWPLENYRGMLNMKYPKYLANTVPGAPAHLQWMFTGISLLALLKSCIWPCSRRGESSQAERWLSSFMMEGRYGLWGSPSNPRLKLILSSGRVYSTWESFFLLCFSPFCSS